ncbi:APC family permease [Thermotalea metallivorans]|uniref:Serine/threonine exchanger SteT n=1 Tax=Thermotalea metallivorans TaxID=520762 RepID=A0A140L2C4_9FIRM|nr:amino acid permease [Thermotalea metallivorans]KXG74699.1 Serine/threonine exchanger SteT [Thermotalea metallivorans]
METKICSSESKELKKEIGLFEAIAVVIGVVIGSGIFFKASFVFKNAGSPLMGILAWIAGGVITMASGLTIAEIATAIPKTGGVFVYLKELYGEKWAFLFGWVQTVIYVPGAAAALAIVFATQATYFIPMTDLQQKLLAIGIIFIIMIGNILSTKLGSKIQFISTIGKLIPIFIIIVYGLAKGTANSFTLSTTGAETITGFGAAILGTLWAYDGWVGVGNIAGELKNPKKDLPKSIIVGVLTIIAVYVFINLAIIHVIPVEDVIASSKPASDAAMVLFGTAGASLISAGILISIFGALNGYLMTGVRIPFAMAQDKLLPFANFFGKVDERFSTPFNAFLLEVILACLYVFSGSFEMLSNLVIFVLWIFFTMAVAGVFILRRKHKNMERPYEVPLYPIVPLIGIIGGLYITINTLITDTTNALYGLGITLIGFPVYMYMTREKKFDL